MKLIPLTQGKFAMVDDEDYEKLNKYKWYAKKGRDTYYVARNSSLQNGIQTTIRMHREILNLTTEKTMIDHINHDTLDNQRHNLRVCTQSQNSMNQVSKRGTSKYKGVSWHKLCGKWQSYIRINWKHTHIGIFTHEEDAARAYDKKAKELFGEYAYLNFKEGI
jgi:hypothetical protein